MNGKIDQKGRLYVTRGVKITKQCCPFGEWDECADYCSLFGNPKYLKNGKTVLDLCFKKLVFDEFADERILTDDVS